MTLLSGWSCKANAITTWSEESIGIHNYVDIFVLEPLRASLRVWSLVPASTNPCSFCSWKVADIYAAPKERSGKQWCKCVASFPGLPWRWMAWERDRFCLLSNKTKLWKITKRRLFTYDGVSSYVSCVYGRSETWWKNQKHTWSLNDL